MGENLVGIEQWPGSSVKQLRDRQSTGQRGEGKRPSSAAETPDLFCIHIPCASLKTFMLTSLRGGLELLFSDQRKLKLALPAHDKDGKPVTVAYLINHLCEDVMKDNRKELFVLDSHMYAPTPYPVKPGVTATKLARH